MQTLLKNEWIKFKHSHLLYWSILSFVAVPIVMFILMQLFYKNEFTIEHYMGLNVKLITQSLSILYFPLIVSEVVISEFKQETLLTQLSIPIDITEFVVVKLMFSMMWIAVQVLGMFLFAVVIGIVFSNESLNLVNWQTIIWSYLRSIILIIPYSLFTIGIVSLFKHHIYGLFFNVSMYFIGYLMRQTVLISPWQSAVNILFKTENTPIIINYILLLCLATIGIWLSIKTIEKYEF